MVIRKNTKEKKGWVLMTLLSFEMNKSINDQQTFEKVFCDVTLTFTENFYVDIDTHQQQERRIF